MMIAGADDVEAGAVSLPLPRRPPGQRRAAGRGDRARASRRWRPASRSDRRISVTPCRVYLFTRTRCRANFVGMTTKQEFHATLRTLSEASVEQNFDAFKDIDWDNPDYEVDPHDPRWKLPREHVLGSHAWYLALPEDEQIRVGLYLQANVTKVGLQFEQILISGVMNYLRTLPNGSPEFRYATHEVTEECHHTQMFQEFVNRSGADVAGGSALLPRGLADPAAVRRPRAVRLLHGRARRRGADRPHAEGRAARRRRHAPAAAADHADPRRRGGPPHRLRAPVPAFNAPQAQRRRAPAARPSSRR